MKEVNNNISMNNAIMYLQNGRKIRVDLLKVYGNILSKVNQYIDAFFIINNEKQGNLVITKKNTHIVN